MSKMPDNLELSTKDAFLTDINIQLDEVQEGIAAERKYMTGDHGHNSGTAFRLVEMYNTYAYKIQQLITMRSVPESAGVFIRDKDTGQLGFKPKEVPWTSANPMPTQNPMGFQGPQSSGPPTPPPPPPKTIGPASPDGAYL